MEREDIESLGWSYNDNFGAYSKGDFKMRYAPSMNHKLEIWTNLANEGYSDIFFRGSIKEKSELVVLLKQLGI